jgi:NADH-quinone oxidoreductase subunit J
MSSAGVTVFYLLAIAAALSALATVTMKNPLRSAVSLLFHIASLAGLYLTLHAHLLAALQLIVYAGAVVVLFVFVIMLIGPVPETAPSVRGIMVRTAGISVLALCGVGMAASVLPYSPKAPIIAGCADPSAAECGQFGGVEAVASVLYGRDAFPFELASFVLLVAILGAIAVAKGRMHAPKSAGTPKSSVRRSIPEGA